MTLYYKVPDIENEVSPNEGIQVHQEESVPTEGPCIKYDFSNHVLIELLDAVTPEPKVWRALGLINNKNVVHKRLLVDPHRVNCRRAIVVCTSSEAAASMAKRLTQAKVMRRCICAIVIQELLSDLNLFEKQIIEYGDKGSQHQLVFVTDLNRPREPASLARYLKEKFSPFGTILSVFVSEGSDGMAIPEGVIRFAHLSEAFAAELAYDQCAVAMERLSVTTHHNILLSQCDLKSRLKKAQSEHHQNNNVGSASNKSSSDEERNNSSNSSVTSETPHPPIRTQNYFPVKIQEPFPTDSEELADALKSPCRDNLVDCLRDIAGDSESSFSKQTEAYTASASGVEFDRVQSSSPKHSAVVSNLGDKSWSTRVLGWISDIPSADEMPPYNDWVEPKLSNENVNCQIFPNLHQTDNVPHGNDIISNSGSFVTCTNGELNTSFNSYISSVSKPLDEESNLNITVLPMNTNCYPNISPNTAPHQNFKEPHQLSLHAEDIYPISTSQKRKNSSLATQKLPIKNQRFDTSQALSEISENDTTIRLSSAFKSRPCLVVLDRLPDLCGNVTLNIKSPTVPKSIVSSYSEKPTTSKMKRSRAGSTVSDSSNATSVSRSLRSLPVRKAARRALQHECNKSSSEISERESAQLRGGNTSEQESPLRLWLKQELLSSTINRVDGSKESLKNILCATANQDVPISVGCSHMTCDFCYPDSTKLLLGSC